MTNRSFWDILAWVVLFLILVWIILKMFGFINTPDILLYAPYFGAVYIAGWAMHKLYAVADEVKDLSKFKIATIKEVNNVRSELNKIDMRCNYNHKL